MPKPSSASKITLYPPRVEISTRSSKYDLIVDVKWGDFTRELSVSKEYPGHLDRMFTDICKALLEASETTKPYILHD